MKSTERVSQAADGGLAAMTSYGADLRKPAHAIHYLYFKSKSLADSAAGDSSRRWVSVNLPRHRIHLPAFPADLTNCTNAISSSAFKSETAQNRIPDSVHEID